MYTETMGELLFHPYQITAAVLFNKYLMLACLKLFYEALLGITCALNLY